MTVLTRRALLGASSLLAAPALTPATTADSGGLKIGVASYSLRKFSRPQAIAILKELGVRYLSIKEFHLLYKDSPEALAQGRKEFDDAGIAVASGGVVNTGKEDDGAIRRYFDYAKACRFPMIIMMPTARQLPAIQKLVQEYGIRVAIHNHGPEDKNFPTPESVYQAIKGFDQRIGVCIDVGHTARTGSDPVQSIRRCADRLLDVHIKDLSDLKTHSDCEVGRGVLPVIGVMKALHKLRYQGNIALEYEAEPDNPMPGMRGSLAYLHGVADTLGA